MSKPVFREKSMERISSPEQLNEYIRVANPGVWVILGAILIFLAGACVWGVFGHLDTKVTATFVGENQEMHIYLQEEDAKKVETGMTVRVEDAEYIVENVTSVPVMAEEALDEYGLYVSGFDTAAWIYEVTVSGTYVEGIMPAEVIVESIAPMTFIFN